MKKEIEVKIRLENKKETQKRLLELGCSIKGLDFQRQYRIRQESLELFNRGIFPRVRENNTGKGTFTIKVKTSKVDDSEMAYFERDEYEVEISDGKELAKMLDLLGFSDQQIMEKYRQTWNVFDSNVDIIIDSLPFGDYLEIEGGKKEIEKMLKNLDLQEFPRETTAYWIVYENYCKKNGLSKKRNLIFGQENL